MKIKLNSFQNYKNILIVISGIIIFLISKNFGMFWDNVLFASKMGNHLYYNSIFNWTIPDSFDPGHPPFLGFLLAIFWKVLGHKLWVSHLVIIPFIIGFLYQIYEFVSHFIEKENLILPAFLLILADPTLSATFVLVNPEIIILFFSFLALNGFLKQKKHLKFIGLFFLSIVSFRGMMLFAGIFLFDVLNSILINKQKIKSVFTLKFLLFYFLASLPAFVFVIWRLTTKGWLQTHTGSPWETLWKFASIKEFLQNCIVLVWRYFDFGRIYIFIFLIVIMFLFKRKILRSVKNRQLLLIAICSVSFIAIVSLFATNTFGHRYFIVSYICFNLIAFILLKTFSTYRKIIYCFLFVGLLSGNLWIYPRKIAQGWDSTLAHIPYYKLRLQAIDYLNNKKIPIEEVATFFPNISTVNNVDFSGDERAFTSFNIESKYVFYSNVYNLSDNDYDELDNNYKLLKDFRKNNITIQILIKK